MPKRGERERRGGRRKAECLIFDERYPASEPAETILFCFFVLVGFVLWSMRDGLEREDTGSVNAGHVVQGLNSKCKNYNFSNAPFCTNMPAQQA